MPHKKRPHRILQRVENFVGNASWDDFVVWCKSKNLQAVPANAWTLAAYIRALESQESLTAIRKRIQDIGKAHAEKSKKRPERDPLIAKTLEIIKLRSEKSADQSTLFNGDDFTDLSSAKNKKPKKPKEKVKKTPNKSPRSRVMSSSPKLVRKRRLK